jgi:hypothetical protein
LCDPLTLGSLAIGAAGTAANSIGQAKAAKQQESAYNDWAVQQKTIRDAENARQEQMRQQAEVSRQQGVQAVSADQQKAAQATEAERLTKLTTGQGDVKPTADPAAPVATADKGMLSGQQYGGDVFQSDLARKLADAAASAKQRIGALATVNSYGGSFGGAGTVNPINQAESGAGIDLANDMRKGSLAAYNTERAVDPQQITYSNPLADVASGFLGAGMQGVGQALGPGGKGISWANIAGKAAAPKVTSSFMGPVQPGKTTAKYPGPSV